MQGCRFLPFFFLLIFSCSNIEPGRSPASSGPINHALSKLREKGAPESFLVLLQNSYREDQRIKVLDWNLLGFLKEKQEMEETIPGWELKRVESFLWKYRKAFSEAEKKFPVPRQIIASLLWVETKYGRDIGTFHVASAFFSLAQADYPTILDQTMDLARQRTRDFTPEIEARVLSRSKQKAEWAVNELMALKEVHEKEYKNALTLEGSFSGAFGMAQFLPSSYLSWAKGRKNQPNLFRADDSIFSVANYLTENGWRKKDRSAQEAALFHYNRDRNYVNRILRMGECLRTPAKIKKWKTRKVAFRSAC